MTGRFLPVYGKTSELVQVGGGEVSEAQALIEDCKALITEIDLPTPFDMHSLRESLGRHWNSTVLMVPTHASVTEPCGMWLSLEIAGEQYDIFGYEEFAPPWHQAQIVLHEVGHRLAGHKGDTTPTGRTTALISALMPTLRPSMLLRSLGCARDPVIPNDQGKTERETKAELIGALLLDRAIGWRNQPLGPSAPEDLRRLHAVLGYTGTRT